MMSSICTLAPGHPLPDFSAESFRDASPDKSGKLLRIGQRIVLVPLQEDLAPLLQLRPGAVLAYLAETLVGKKTAAAASSSFFFPPCPNQKKGFSF